MDDLLDEPVGDIEDAKRVLNGVGIDLGKIVQLITAFKTPKAKLFSF